MTQTSLSLTSFGEADLNPKDQLRLKLKAENTKSEISHKIDFTGANFIKKISKSWFCGFFSNLRFITDFRHFSHLADTKCPKLSIGLIKSNLVDCFSDTISSSHRENLFAELTKKWTKVSLGFHIPFNSQGHIGTGPHRGDSMLLDAKCTNH